MKYRIPISWTLHLSLRISIIKGGLYYNLFYMNEHEYISLLMSLPKPI